MPEVTGTIENATIYFDGDVRSPCLNGAIYGDIRGKFPDGTIVTTSTLMEHIGGDLFKTRNSIYRVGSWRASK